MITLIFHRINLTKLYISRMEKKNYLLYFTRIYVILSFMFLTSPTKYRYDSSRDSTRVAQQNCIKISWQSSYIYILLINNARLYRLLAFFCFFKPSFLKIGRQKIKKKRRISSLEIAFEKIRPKGNTFHRIRSICGKRIRQFNSIVFKNT